MKILKLILYRGDRIKTLSHIISFDFYENSERYT